MNHDEDLKLSDGAYFSQGYPHELWRRLRNEDPVHLTNSRIGRDYWSVTRHADVQAVLSDQILFSSQRSGVSLPTSVELADPSKSEHARLSQAGAMLPVLDAPRHALARSQFVRRFTPKVINGYEDKVRAVVRKILDTVPDGKEFDFVLQVAARLPSSMIFAMMDLPVEDWDMMFNYTNMHTAPDDPEFSIGSPIETRERGFRGIIDYCKALALQRRKNPGEDLISHIGSVEIEGQKLSDDEIGFLGNMFIVAGQETTRNSLSAGLYELMQNPDKLAHLRANRALLTTAPDEFIRWASPIAHLMRTATADTELGGKTIREGDWVVVWLASANRDERAFANPDLFDLGRSPNPHVSFGFGPHFCLGAFFGRLQIRVMLEELLARFHKMELSGDPDYVASIQFFGMKHLAVTFS